METTCMFHDRLRHAMAEANRDECQVAVLALTMDHYSDIKSSLGYEACSALLMHAAAAMGDCLRGATRPARLLGNVFALIVQDLPHDEDIRPVAANLLEAIKQPLRWQSNCMTTTASVGIALASDGRDSAGMLRAAKVAMADAVRQGGNRFCFYAQDLNERSLQMWAREAESRRAARSSTMLPLWGTNNNKL